jgi:hypothetical protein
VSHKLLRVLTPALCMAIVVSGLLSGEAMYAAVAGGLVLLYVLGAPRPGAAPAGAGAAVGVPAAAYRRAHRVDAAGPEAADVWAP